MPTRRRPMKSRLLTGCSFLMFGVAMAYGFITLTGLMVASSEWSGIAVLAETATLLLCALAAVSSFLMWKRLNAGWWITLASASLLAVWHGVSVARTALILRRTAGEGDDRLYYVREKMLSECLYYLIPPVALLLFLLWVRSEFNSRPEPKLETENLF
jgi:hypothetical protein